MTNADKIRAMSDEAFAEYLKFEGGCRPDMTEDTCFRFDSCEECWLDWLKQKAKEEHNNEN